MQQLIKTVMQLCFLRAGPQHLPAKSSYLLLSALVYLSVRLLSAPWLVVVETNFITVVVELCAIAALVYLFLNLVHKPERALQTLEALWLVSIVIWMISFPVLAQIQQSDEGELQISDNIQVVLLILMVWELLVTANIFRHAVAQKFSIGILIALAYSALLYWVVNGLTLMF